MKKKLKLSFILISLLLLISSFFCFFPNIQLLADNSKNYATTSGSRVDYDNMQSFDDLYNSYTNLSYSYTGITLPSEYCMRDEYMIIAENQTQQGLCWAFGSSMTLSTTIMKQTNEFLNFSESYVSTALTNCVKNKEVPEAFNGYFNDFYPGDGGWFYSFDFAARKYGLVLEQDYTYDESYLNCLENNDEFYSYYSSFANHNLLNNYLPVYFINYLETQNYKTTIINSIKQHIIENGAIAASYYWDNTSSTKYNNKNIEYKVPNEDPNTGHLLTLIGYDDNIQITHDSTTYTGAWIALNSWGNNENQGVCYIMYDDNNLRTTYAYIYDKYLEDDLYMYNTLSNSNGSYLTDLAGAYYGDFTTREEETKQKNMFYCIDDIELEYSYEVSNNTNITSVEIYNTDTLVTDKFNIEISNKNNLINISADNLDCGSYKIIFNYKNSTKSESTISAFYLLNGTEISDVYMYSGNNYGDVENNGLYQNHNNLNYFNDEITIVSSNNQVGLQNYRIVFSVYNDIESYSFSDETDIRHQFYKNKGYILLQTSLDFNENKIISLYLFTSHNYTKNIKIRFLTFSSNCELTHIFYELNGGKNNSENYKKDVINSNMGLNIYNPTKNGYDFAGWYYDKNFTMPLTYNNNLYILEYDYINIISSPTVGWSYYEDYYKKSVYVFLYAKWEAQSLTITISSNNTEYGSVTPYGNNKVIKDGSLTFSVIVNSGYYVSKITIDNIPLSSSNLENVILNGYTFLNVNKNHTVFVEFEIKSYNISYNLNFNNRIETQSVLYKSVINLLTNSDINREGYTLVGWYSDSNCLTIFTETTMPAKDLTLYAKWSKNIYSITIYSDDNSNITPNGIVEIEYLQSKTFEFSVNEGYHISEIKIDGRTLSSVELNNAILNGYTFNNVNSNHTISVKSSINVFTITATSSSNGSINPNGIVEKNYNESQKYIFTANKGCYVENVFIDNIALQGEELTNAISNGYTFTNICNNHTIKVDFKIKTFKIYYNLNYPSSENFNENYQYNGKITLITDISRKGYIFIGWYNEPECLTEFSTAYMPENDLTVYAKWEIYLFTLTYNLNYENKVLVSQTYKFEDKIILPIAPIRKGYTFTGWFNEENNLTEFNLLTMPAQNVNLFAGWNINQYTINSSCNSFGTITPLGTMQKTFAEEINFNLTPNDGYYVSKIIINNSEIINKDKELRNFKLIVEDNCNINFEFVKKVFNITYNLSDGGKINNDTYINSIEYGKSHEIKINLNFNKTINKIFINNEEVKVVNNIITLENIEEDLVIDITFKTKSFFLTPLGLTLISLIALSLIGGVMVLVIKNKQKLSNKKESTKKIKTESSDIEEQLPTQKNINKKVSEKSLVKEKKDENKQVQINSAPKKVNNINNKLPKTMPKLNNINIKNFPKINTNNKPNNFKPPKINK